MIEYIENRYEEFLNAESRVNRKTVPDNRVHCCLYMIAPSGHGLKPLDVELMKRLHDKVNLIPLIAKADTMTPEECNHFKKQVNSAFFYIPMQKLKVRPKILESCNDKLNDSIIFGPLSRCVFQNSAL